MKKITFLLIIPLLAIALDGWGQIISQYIETNSGTTPKGVEIWNNTTSALDFSTNNLVIWKGTNGAAPSVDYTLSTGTLAAGDVIVIGTSDLQTVTENNGSTFYEKGFTFNGDDALEVWYGTTKTDVFGDPGDDPGSGWSGNGVQTWNQNIQLLTGITAGDTDGWTDPSTRFETVSTDPATDGGVGFGIAPAAGGGNQTPVITNIVHTPEFPTSSDAVTVSADITDSDGTLTTAEMNWGTTSGSLTNTETMSNGGSGDSYSAIIIAQANNTTVYFEIVAEDDEGGITTSPEQSYVLPATTALPYFEPFDNNLGACYVFSVAGNTKNWLWNASGAASMNGYDSGETEEDWLILPAVNFDDYTGEIMTFDTWYNYGTGDDETDHYLKLYYSSDYQGTGDPGDASWTEMSYTQPSAAAAWASSGNIDVSALTGTVYFAFKYRYTDNYRWWGVNNISIFEDMVDVTFQVDMQNVTPSGDGVFLVGDFSPDYPDWDLGDLPMDDTDGDLIYTITLTLEANRDYQFKYVNGLSWDDAENPPSACTAEGNSNRVLTTGIFDNTLDLVCYGLCTDCSPDSYDITFQVDMQNETVSGDGVYLAGTFTDWTNSDQEILMTNSIGTIWSTTVSLAEATDQEYKFINGDPNNGGEWENSISNRFLAVPGENTTLGFVCFDSYDACPPAALLFSEIADPYDNIDARFIELYNASGSTIDFDIYDYYIVKQVNGGTFYSFKLVSDVLSGDKFVVAGNSDGFNTAYGFTVYQSNTDVSGNGDDGYYLYYNGDHTSGTLVDAYGVIDEDGTGKGWEYTDTKAVRLNWVSAPNSTWTSWEWDIPEVAGVQDMTPQAHKEDVTWQGTTDNMWFTKGDNWSGSYGYVPDASFNVTIPDVANPSYIWGQSACNNLTINTDAVVGVGVTTFDIYGDLVVNVNGEFTLGADGTQNASVIVHGTASGDANVERVIQGWDEGANNGWHNISSPVNNLVVAGSSFEPGDNDDLYQWDEVSNTWENYKQGHFSSLENGRGYLNAFELSGTKYFVGTLNTDDVAVSGLTKDDGGFHLLGNPFTSSLIWNTSDWNLTGIGGIAQIWDESNNGYAQLSQYASIPSTNGFFVEVDAAPGGLTIPKYARVHNLIDNYKMMEALELEETLDLRLTNDENSFYDLCRVGFKEDATEAWDIEYDAHKLFGGTGTSQIWSVVNDENFVYNFIPYVYESNQLPIYFRAGVNATHHINVEGIESFYDNSGIYLEDLKTGNLINLSEQQMYTFTALTEDDEARFILHFSGITTVGEEIPAEEVQVYANGNSVYFRFETMPKDDARVSVFNILGQQVYGGELGQSTLSSIRLNEKSGIYVVRLQTEKGTTTQKVMIK